MRSPAGPSWSTRVGDGAGTLTSARTTSSDESRTSRRAVSRSATIPLGANQIVPTRATVTLGSESSVACRAKRRASGPVNPASDPVAVLNDTASAPGSATGADTVTARGVSSQNTTPAAVVKATRSTRLRDTVAIGVHCPAPWSRSPAQRRAASAGAVPSVIR